MTQRPDPAFDRHPRAFDELPPESLVRAFGVDYCHLTPPEGGDLYVTRFGWPVARQLMPAHWFTEKWYLTHGERLHGSTGVVYHVPSRPYEGRSADLLIKFSRMAQEVPLVVQTTFPDDVAPETIAAARFNSPMEEFGLVMELRGLRTATGGKRIRTQRPLAIYAPPDEFQLWQLGRDESRFNRHRSMLAQDQEDEVKAIELDIRRMYVMLYHWVKGRDAAESCREGTIGEHELKQLTQRVIAELNETGFRVLDNKPQHFILRQSPQTGPAVRGRDGQLAYALVDFELLQRTSEHQLKFKANQRHRYRQLRQAARSAERTRGRMPLNTTTILGVEYVYGIIPDGGWLWVTGRSPDLFEFFVPDRWRRTPRVRLSGLNEVYRTHTRDNVHIIYRRSRVGTAPHVDPITESGRRIREHGYNSPFEEISIAEQLRGHGISTTVPLAIYRTGHHSNVAQYLQDRRRFDNRGEANTTGEHPEPFLIPDHDYYTIWDMFRGVHPEAREDGHHNFDLDDACELKLINQRDRDQVLRRARDLLSQHGVANSAIEGFECGVHLGEDGSVLRDKLGDIDATIGFDALAAFEVGLLDEITYREIIQQLQTRLHAADCEKLDLKGSHMLLSLDMNGEFKSDTEGLPIATLCNFEFIRGLYRPWST